MRQNWLFVTVAIILLALSGACTPQNAPAPEIAPKAAPSTAAPSTQLAPPAPADAAWDKVVDAAKKEGHLTIYGSAQFAGDKGRITIKAFQDKYGIQTELLNMAGRQNVERVTLEQRMKQPIADVVGTGESSSTELSQVGLTASVWQELPEFKDKSIFRVDPVFTSVGDILSMVLKTNGPMINTNMVKPQDEPRSYTDLLDPKWKGKVILEDPRGGGAGGFTWFGVMRYYKLLDDDYFRRFAKQQPILWGGSSAEAFNMVGRGEAWLTPHGASGSAGFLIVEGAPLKILGMKEGNIVTSDVITVVKGAAHPNAAKLFVNWIFSREGQTVYARSGSLESMRKDVPDFVDPRVKLQPEPQKLLSRTNEIADALNRYHKEGIAESIFGNK